MKTNMRVTMVASALLVAPLLWVSAVFAEDVPTSTKTNTNTSTNTTTVTTSEQKQDQLTADQKNELRTRLEKRKAELKTKLSTLEQQKIKAKCKSTQGNFSSLEGRIKGIETSRTEVYGGLISRLSLLSSRLQNQGVDNAPVQAHIDALKTKIETFNTDLTAYKQSVIDLKNMDCAADPTAYKASLEASRAALTKVQADAKAIRTYVNDSVKPTLEQIKSQLQKS